MSNEALEIQQSTLAEIDLESPTHYIEDNSLPAIELPQDFLNDYTSNISALEMEVFNWATTKDMVRGGIKARGPTVYSAEFGIGIIDKAGIQSMKPRGHLEDTVVQIYSHLLNKREYRKSKMKGQNMERFIFPVWAAVINF